MSTMWTTVLKPGKHRYKRFNTSYSVPSSIVCSCIVILLIYSIDMQLFYQPFELQLQSSTQINVVEKHNTIQHLTPQHIKPVPTYDSLAADISTQWHASLNNWLNKVQIPFTNGVYKTAHELVYYVDPGVWNGGLTDRQRGVISILLLAIVLNRPFTLRWDTPASLSHSLQPNLFDYTYQSQQYRSNENLIKLIWIDGGHEQFPSFIQRLQSEPNTIGVVDTNLFLLEDIRQHLSTELHSVGINDSVQFWPIYASLYSVMYKLHDNTEQLIQQSLSQQQPAMILYDRTQIILQQNNTDHIEPVYMVCLQYRHGNSAEFADSQTLANEHGLVQSINILLQDIYEYVQDTQNTQHIAVFVTGDTTRAIQLFNEHLQAQYWSTQYTHRIAVFALNGQSVHISRPGVQNGESAQMKAVADNWMLGLCDNAVVTRTGFGISGVVRTNTVEKVRLLNTDRNQAEQGQYELLNKTQLYSWNG